MRKLKLTFQSGWCILMLLMLWQPSVGWTQCDSGTISGKVFLDANADGLNNSESGVAGIPIDVYDSTNTLVGQATSAADGSYQITGMTDGDGYRLEFGVTATYNLADIGGVSNTDVLFIKSPYCTADLGLMTEGFICSTNPEIFLTCFVRTGTAGADGLPTILGITHDFDNSSPLQTYATHSETGSVWGIDYHDPTQQIFSAAFVKQYTDLRYGHDAIMATDVNTSTTSLYTNLSSLGITTGAMTYTDVYDCRYGEQVGYLGLGGIVAHSNGSDLYTVNLHNNSIVKLSATNPDASTTFEYPVPDPGCVYSEYVTFALTEYNGLLYVGVTCTAKTPVDEDISSVHVYSFDPVTAQYSYEFGSNKSLGFWKDYPSTDYHTAHWLTDIEFTDEGNMVLMLSDRLGHRYCDDNRGRLDEQRGDTWFVANVNGAWVLESNGSAGGFTGSGVNNGQGIDGGEFFAEDTWFVNDTYHNENNLGSGIIIPGTGELISMVFDPEFDTYSGGMHRYSTTDGSLTGYRTLYRTNITQQFGKATGFGGLADRCGYAGIEIGNYVWFDSNADGQQGPDESPAANVPIYLWDENCNLVGSTVTDADGSYVFKSGTSVDNNGQLFDGIFTESTYYITLDTSLYVGGNEVSLNGNTYFTTAFLVDENSNSNLQLCPPDDPAKDQLCPLLTDIPFIQVTTGDMGQNDYTFDIGLRLPNVFDLALAKKLDGDIYVTKGDFVKYDIEVINQGEVTAYDVTIVDYIPSGYAFDPLINPGWAYDGTVAEFLIEDPIPGGTQVVIPIYLEVVDSGPGMLENYAEIAEAYDENGDPATDIDSSTDSDPNNDSGADIGTATDDEVNGDPTIDEDDHDVATVYVADLALEKRLASSEIVMPGEEITYIISVKNEGNVNVAGFQVIDYLPEELFFDFNRNPGWVAVTNGLVYDYASTVVPGEIVDIPLIVTAPQEVTENRIVNIAEISGFQYEDGRDGDDYDSQPDLDATNDPELSGEFVFAEDDIDAAIVVMESFDLALILTSPTFTACEEDLVEYTISIFNQGSVIANNIGIVDYIPEGMSLADPRWTPVNDSTATINLILGGGLKPGGSTQETIILRLDDKGDKPYKINYAEIFYTENLDGIDFSGRDLDSTPDSQLLNDNGGEAFSINDNRLDGNGINDEDDHDPAALYFVDIFVEDPCVCLNNATTDTDGQFSDELVVIGPSGQTWTIDYVTGFYDAALSLPPPSAPVEFSVGDVLTEFANGDGTSRYTLTGLHVTGQGYQIRLMNDDGVFLQHSGEICEYETARILYDSNAACVGDEVTYTIDPAYVEAGCSYRWALTGSGTVLSPTDGIEFTVLWDVLGGPNTISLLKECPDRCIAPTTVDIEVGESYGPMACAGELNISLNSECELLVTAEMVLATDPSATAYGVMVFDPYNNLIPDNVITYDQLGQTLTVKVIDPCSGNSCWSEVFVEEKVAPTIQCGDIVVPCYALDTYVPIVEDNCTEVEVELLNETVTPYICHPDYVKEVQRSYRAVDAHGNVSPTCTQTIQVKRFPFDEVVFPDNYEIITDNAFTCSDILYDEEGYPAYQQTGVPTLLGAPLYPDFEFYCNVLFSYEDVLIADNGCIKKYMRTWKYYEDYCTPGVYETRTQVIEIIDDEDPVIECPVDATISTSGSSCEMLYTLPTILVSDDCTAPLNIDVQYPGGFINNLETNTFYLETGENVITLTVYDGCDNSSSCTYTVTVLDDTPPVAICDLNTVVSLNSSGTAWAPASSFDDGSYDDCGLKSVLVQRMGDFDCPCDPPEFDEFAYLGEYEGHHYYKSKHSNTGYFANAYSDAFGGYLTVVNDQAEQDWLNGKVFEDYYIAPSANVAGYENFGTTATAEEYIYVSAMDGQWRYSDGVPSIAYVFEVNDPCSWSNKVNFCCTDSGNTTMVAIRAIDYFGSTNNCMVNVTVQDKVSPEVICPDDMTVSCLEHLDFADLSIYGEASATDVCGVTLSETSSINIDECGVGEVRRTFTASDGTNNSVCTQTIYVINDDILTEADIDWPDDLTLNDGCMADLDPDNLAAQFSRPIVNSTTCDLIGMSYSDEAFVFDGEGACLKILRRWAVLNSCESDVPFVYYQTFKVNDLTVPTVTVDPVDAQICSFDVNCGGTFVPVTASATDDCEMLSMNITYSIDYDSDTVVDLEGTAVGSTIDLSDVYPIGAHTIIITFEDGCGNRTAETINFEVISCKTPVAVCIDGISIGLQAMDTDGDGVLDNEMACIFTEQLDKDSYHPCGTDIDLSFDSTQVVGKLTFDCFDIGINEINLYVIDANGLVDYCTATVEVQDNNDFDACPEFDLALIKTVNTTLTPSPIQAGDNVVFDITIYNQGTLDAETIQINDYIPDGLTLNDSDWTETNGVATLNSPIASLLIGQSVVVPISFTVDPGFMGTSITNNAEIASAWGPNSLSVTDTDSTPNSEDGSTPDPNNDDILLQDGSDDYDPETIMIEQVFDLALIKLLNSVLSDSPVIPGSSLTFNISVLNQGTLDAYDVQVNDYIPDGLTLADPNWSLNGTTANLLTPIPVIAAGSTVTRTITFTVDSDFTGSTIINDAEIQDANLVDGTDGNDVDSTPDNDETPDDITNDNNIVDTDGGDDQDPAEVSVTQIYDLALIKTVDVTTTPAPYDPGDEVAYDITVTNQGTLPANNIEVTDYIPAGMSFVSSSSFTLVNGQYIATIGQLLPGQSATVSLLLMIDADFMGSNLINDAEITADDGDDIDSTPNDDSTPDDVTNDDDVNDPNGGDDQDPAVITVTQMYDLALVKTLDTATTPGPFTPGDQVTYNITVFNQGTVDANNIEVTDYVPAGMTFVSSPDFNLVNGAYVAVIPSISAQGSATVSITLMINSSFMGDSIINDAEITADDGDDSDSTPGDDSTPDDVTNDNDVNDPNGGDDQDPEVITVEQVFDLALTKVINTQLTPPPYAPGDNVTFTIEVTNQGTIDAVNTVVTDYIPAGMTFVSSPNFGVINGTANATIPFLAPQGSTTLSITLMIDNDFMGTSLVNDAEIVQDSGDDVDSTPGDNATPNDLANDNDTADTNGGDDQDPAMVLVGQMFDLALTKVIDFAETPGPFGPGSQVAFDITVFNQGTIDGVNIEVTDYIPAGMNFVSSNDFVLTNGEYVATIPSVPAMGSVTVSILLEVDINSTADMFINDAEITADNGDDIDSTPGDDATPDDVANDNDIMDATGGDDQDPAVVVADCDITDFCEIVPDTIVRQLDEFGEFTVTIESLGIDTTLFCGDIDTIIFSRVEYFCNDQGCNTLTITVTDVLGNTVECMTELCLFDPINIVNCPGDLEIPCTSDVSELTVFGSLVLDQNCEAGVTVDSTTVQNLDDCNIGSIVRSWIVTDALGSTEECVQIITVSAMGATLQLSDITFPGDLTTTCTETDTSFTGVPVINENAVVCGDITVAFVDDVTGPECMEVINRTWTITDLCSGAVFTDVQVITVVDDNPPVITIPVLPDTIFIMSECEQFVDLVATAIDPCSSITSMTNDSPVSTDQNTLDASGNYEQGSYTVTFTATDACGNTATEIVSFVVDYEDDDDFACVKDIFEVDNGVTTVIEAIELAPPFYVCNDVNYEFFFLGGNPLFDSTPDTSMVMPTISVDCSNVGEVFNIFVGVYLDGEYTGFFCVAEVDVNDDNMDCPIPIIGENTELRLEQNRPNPFSESTEIYFKVDTETDVVVTIVDFAGMPVMNKTLRAEPGMNMFEVRDTDLPAGGVYYYQIQDGTRKVWNKMIFIK